MKIFVVDKLSTDVIEHSRKQLLDLKNVRYGLLVERGFQKFKLIRLNERPNTFTVDRTRKHPIERLQSIYHLIDGVSFSKEPFNESILDLFEVKSLVEEFYSEYRTVREKLASQINGIVSGARELFAQVILDRIIFVYFLQARSVLPEDYLLQLYEQAVKNDRNYHEFYLRPLFFELLNSEDSETKAKYRERFGTVPYLNGGLFRRREFESDTTRVPNQAWKPVFDLFEGYEWVVEDTESGGLTPEILGHIFEMSMNEGERKGSGSYYTPREATRLICERVIERFVCDAVAARIYKRFESFDSIVKANDKAVLEIAYLSLLNIRIVDPAVGSGAFLVAAEDVLVTYLNGLFTRLKELDSSATIPYREEFTKLGNSLLYYLKKHIMTHNLYGVDINPDGVEICKLRLWLSMITEANKIEPLPNIEFNVRQGNSVLGFFDVAGDVGDTATLEDPQAIRTKFRERNNLVTSFRAERNTIRAESLKHNIDDLSAKFREELNRKLELKLGRVDSQSSKSWFNPFHWVMEFSDIFDEGGFDVVVGNPPFTRNELIAKDYKEALVKVFRPYARYMSGLMGLYGYFIILCDKILRQGGRASYVLPSTVLRVESTAGLRELLLDKTIIESIFVRNTKAAFSNDTSLREIIIIFRRPVGTIVDYVSEIVRVGELTSKEREILQIQKPGVSLAFDTYSIPRDELRENSQNLFRLVGNPPRLLTLWKSFVTRAAKELVTFDNFIRANRAEVVRGIETKSHSNVPVQAMFVLREANRARKQSEKWVLDRVDSKLIRARNRFTGVIVSIPKSAVSGGSRSQAELYAMNLSGRLDFVVADDFPESQRMFGEATSKIRRNIHAWRKYVDERLGHIILLRRFDLSSSGTRNLAYYADELFVGAGINWDIRGLSQSDAKQLCVWFNSALNMLQLFINRIETRGAWINLHEYALNELLVPSFHKMGDIRSQEFELLFEELKDEKFPSFLEQLTNSNQDKVQIDLRTMELLGFDKREAEVFLSDLYPALAEEIDRLKTMMGAG
jgi:type I restriction-modification system DNA methylase subunit